MATNKEYKKVLKSINIGNVYGFNDDLNNFFKC